MAWNAAQLPRKPNLVVFLPDQQRFDTLAAYGNDKVHAPNLNRLAAESVVFERAYVTQPVCTPSRASLMSGRWPHQTGCTRNNEVLGAEFRGLPELLDDPDYTAAYFGKWHLGDNSSAQRGFTQWVSTEKVSDYQQYLLGQGIQPDRSNKTFSRRKVSTLPAELSKPRFLEEHACEFIRQHRDRPFILFVAFVEPHSPYNGPLNDEHDAAGIELDPTAEAPPREDIPLRYRLMREWQRTEAIEGHEEGANVLYFGLTREDYREIRRRYYGLITLVDQSIGGILRCLEETGNAGRTIVVHTSDHGDMLGGHHLFGKEVMFDPSVRVPWLLRLPGEPGRRVSHPVSHIDFLPTLLDLLGGAPADNVSAAAFFPCSTVRKNRLALPLSSGHPTG